MARKNNSAANRVLLMALALGASVENAAHKAGIGERTAYRRLADPAFKALVNQARLEVALRTTGMLTGAGPGSVKTLVDLQYEASAPAGVRRAAARDVLDLGHRFRGSDDLLQRVVALEELLAQLRPKRC